MKVFYDEGVPIIKFGPYELRINEAKEIPDKDAEDLIRKGRVKAFQEKTQGAKNKEQKN